MFKEIMRGLLIVFGIAIAIIGVIAFGVFLKGTFAPRVEQIRYDVHKESQIYRDGIVREIRDNLIMMHAAENEVQQRLLCQQVLDLADQHGRERLPPNIQAAVSELGDCITP